MRLDCAVLGCCLALASCARRSGASSSVTTSTGDSQKKQTSAAPAQTVAPSVGPVPEGARARPATPAGSGVPNKAASPVRAKAAPEPDAAQIEVPVLPPRVEPQNDTEKKLDGSLLQIERAARTGGAVEAQAKAKSLSVLSDGNRVKIDVALTDKSKVADFQQAIADLGGEVIVSLENHVFVYLPAGSIEPVALRTDVFSMTTASPNVRQ